MNIISSNYMQKKSLLLILFLATHMAGIIFSSSAMASNDQQTRRSARIQAQNIAKQQSQNTYHSETCATKATRQLHNTKNVAQTGTLRQEKFASEPLHTKHSKPRKKMKRADPVSQLKEHLTSQLDCSFSNDLIIQSSKKLHEISVLLSLVKTQKLITKKSNEPHSGISKEASFYRIKDTLLIKMITTLFIIANVQPSDTTWNILEDTERNATELILSNRDRGHHLPSKDSEIFHYKHPVGYSLFQIIQETSEIFTNTNSATTSTANSSKTTANNTHQEKNKSKLIDQKLHKMQEMDNTVKKYCRLYFFEIVECWLNNYDTDTEKDNAFNDIDRESLHAFVMAAVTIRYIQKQLKGANRAAADKAIEQLIETLQQEYSTIGGIKQIIYEFFNSYYDTAPRQEPNNNHYIYALHGKGKVGIAWLQRPSKQLRGYEDDVLTKAICYDTNESVIAEVNCFVMSPNASISASSLKNNVNLQKIMQNMEQNIFMASFVLSAGSISIWNRLIFYGLSLLSSPMPYQMAIVVLGSSIASIATHELSVRFLKYLFQPRYRDHE